MTRRAVAGERDVHQAAAASPRRRKRTKTRVSDSDDREQEEREHRARLPVGEAGAEEVDDLVPVHVAARAADERRRDELADRRDEDEEERGDDARQR